MTLPQAPGAASLISIPAISTTPAPLPRLILGSSSPYRRALLSRLLLPFDVVAPRIDEQPQPGESPAATALRLAIEKAAAVAALHPQTLVIGSDQVAVLDDEQIGKPGNHAAALAQLQKMRGRTVAFHTALCLYDGRTAAPVARQTASVITEVVFRNLPDAMLDAYLHIEQPYDCAGSAKNEGLGIALIASCASSDPSALTGLPLIALCDMFHRAGVALFSPASAAIAHRPAANAGKEPVA